MRVAITLIIVFFSHLFLNVAQAAVHASTEKKSDASTDDRHLKKAPATKNVKKTPEPTPKHTQTTKKKATPESVKEKKHAQTEKKSKEIPVAKASKTAALPPPSTAPKKTAQHPQQTPSATKTAAMRNKNETPAQVVKGLKKTAEKQQKTASVKSGTKKSAKEIALTDAHKRRYQHAKMTAMNKLMSQIGKPYQWGGNSPYTGFDCSGLVYYAYKDVVKIPIPRTANEMYHLRDAAPINKNELEIGDLVFFRINHRGTADHVGVYLGNGKFIQSPRTGADIKISKLSEDYWQEHYIGARRVVTPQTIR